MAPRGFPRLLLVLVLPGLLQACGMKARGKLGVDTPDAPDPSNWKDIGDQYRLAYPPGTQQAGPFALDIQEGGWDRRKDGKPSTSNVHLTVKNAGSAPVAMTLFAPRLILDAGEPAPEKYPDRYTYVNGRKEDGPVLLAPGAQQRRTLVFDVGNSKPVALQVGELRIPITAWKKL